MAHLKKEMLCNTFPTFKQYILEISLPIHPITPIVFSA